MHPKVNLIPAEEAHLEQLVRLAECSFPDPWSAGVFRQTMHSPASMLWCAMDGEIVVGYLAISRTGDDMSVDELAVHPDYRRQGIAGMLLETAHRRFPDSHFFLEVRQSYASAIALYDSLGYAPVGFRKRFYQNPEEGAVLMQRKCHTNPPHADPSSDFGGAVSEPVGSPQ